MGRQQLGFGELPLDEGLPREGVPYIPAVVEEIVAVVREVPLRPDGIRSWIWEPEWGVW